MPRPTIDNKYIDIDEETVGIEFNSIVYGRKLALFDREDLDRLKVFKWEITSLSKRNKTHYVKCRPWRYGDTAKWFIPAHRYILSFPDMGEVDHINQNGLDNRKINLRLVTKSENAINKTSRIIPKSGYRGVYFIKKCTLRPWAAELRRDKKLTRIGNYKTKEEAAEAYEEYLKR